MNLSKRSYQKELLDRDDIPFEDIKQNLKELNTINTLLGGHNITLSGIRQLLARKNKNEAIHIVEIGCGGGDNLAYLRKKLTERTIHYTGIDLKDTCVNFAKATYPDIEFIQSDYKSIVFKEKPDIIFSSLFCHHFTDEQLVVQYKWMHAHSKIGFVINDLQRHRLAYLSIKLLTKFFSKSYLVKNDAPLSVARGFLKHELHKLLNEAGVPLFTTTWRWAFRYLVIARTQ